MKKKRIASWPTFLITITLGVGMLLYQLTHMNSQIDLWWALLWAWLVFDGLRFSLFPSIYDQNRKLRAKKNRQIYRQRLGPLGLFVPWIPGICFVVAGIVAVKMPQQKGLIAALLFLTVALVLAMMIFFYRTLRKDQENEDE